MTCVLMSCAGKDSRATVDSSLARDLAQANQGTPDLVPKDTALKRPETRRIEDRGSRIEEKTTSARIDTPRSSIPDPRSSAAALEEPTITPKFRGILAGASFPLTTKAAVCTTNLPGDKITATVDSDVVGENGAVIPAGTTVVLEVAQVTPGDKPETATITLRIRSVIVNDQPVAVPSDVSVTSELQRHTMPRDKGADRKKVIGGVVAGAIVGQILGKDTKSTVTGAVVGGAAGAAAAAATGTKYDVCLPAGGAVRATTREPVPLTSSQ
jgi:hypothetical protein